MAALAATLQGCSYDELGVRIPNALGWDDWCREAQDLQWRHRAILWQLGDIFVWGERRFPQMYAQAVEPYSEESIQRAMFVCKVFPRDRRRPLGFSFHQAVIYLPKERSGGQRSVQRPQVEQDELLDACVKAGWAREAFREEIKNYDQRQLALVQPHVESADLGAGSEMHPFDQAGEEAAELVEKDAAATSTVVSPGLSDTGDAPAAVIHLAEVRAQRSPLMTADDAAEILATAVRDQRITGVFAEAIQVILAERRRAGTVALATEGSIQ